MAKLDQARENLNKAFGIALRQQREKCNLSQENLGFESGYHRTYISLLERGIKAPSLTAIFNLSKALKIKPSELIHSVESQLLSISVEN